MTDLFTSSAAVRPPLITAPVGKSAMTRVNRRTAATAKASITDDFTTLDNFVALAKEPYILSGRLYGEGVVRYRDQMATDDFKVTATIGGMDVGSTRIVTCGDESFANYYAVEIDTNPIVAHVLAIVKGSGASALLEGGIFSKAVTYHSIVTLPSLLQVGDQVSAWWDEDASTVRAFVNGVERTSLAVPRYEIPHGHGFRHWGAAIGVDVFLDAFWNGVDFTSIAAEDV